MAEDKYNVLGEVKEMKKKATVLRRFSLDEKEITAKTVEKVLKKGLELKRIKLSDKFKNFKLVKITSE